MPPRKKEVKLEDLEKMIKSQIEWSEINYSMLKRISRMVFWGQVAGWIKLLMIVVPIIFGILYLKPVVEKFIDVFSPYVSRVNPAFGIFNLSEQIVGDSYTIQK